MNLRSCPAGVLSSHNPKENAMKKVQRNIHAAIIEHFNSGMDVAEITNALLDDRTYRRWIMQNVGNEFDTRHFVEELLCETAEVGPPPSKV